MANDPRPTDVNPDTGLRHSMTLSEAFDNIRMAPGEIATLISSWAEQHRGGAQDALAQRLAQHARDLTDVEKQGRTPSEARTSDVAVGDDWSQPDVVGTVEPNPRRRDFNESPEMARERADVAAFDASRATNAPPPSAPLSNDPTRISP